MPFPLATEAEGSSSRALMPSSGFVAYPAPTVAFRKDAADRKSLFSSTDTHGKQSGDDLCNAFLSYRDATLLKFNPARRAAILVCRSTERYHSMGAIPERECAQCRAKHRSISHTSSVQVLRSRRSLYRLAHHRRRRRAPITGGPASHCRIVTISTPCIAGLPLRRPRPCLTRRNTAFFAGCRRTRSEGRVIHSCRASVFSASHATCRRAHAQTSIVMFSDTHGRVVFR